MNTIILKHNEKMLTKEEYRKFEKGDLIWGDAETPEEVKRWMFDESDVNEVKEEAKEPGRQPIKLIAHSSERTK